MSQAYSNPKRATDPYTLPNVEVWREPIAEVTCVHCGTFEVPESEAYGLGGAFADPDDLYCPSCERGGCTPERTERMAYWFWYCLPGCMPDSSPHGPYATLEEAQAEYETDEDEDEAE